MGSDVKRAALDKSRGKMWEVNESGGKSRMPVEGHNNWIIGG
jgi:hypothetical protein